MTSETSWSSAYMRTMPPQRTLAGSIASSAATPSAVYALCVSHRVR